MPINKIPIMENSGEREYKIAKSIKKELKANEYFDLTNIKDFKVVGSYDVKSNRIYAKP